MYMYVGVHVHVHVHVDVNVDADVGVHVHVDVGDDIQSSPIPMRVYRVDPPVEEWSLQWIGRRRRTCMCRESCSAAESHLSFGPRVAAAQLRPKVVFAVARLVSVFLGWALSVLPIS